MTRLSFVSAERSPAPRIVSLLPSATEILCALGAGENVVGISHECDFPEAIRGRPVLTRSRIDAHGSSRAIDTAVRAVLHGALSIYAVDEERLGALQPDVIITQDLCDVCAVSLDDVRAAVARLVHSERVRIVSLRPTRLEEALGDVERVAAAIGREPEGTAVRAALGERIRAIAGRAKQAPARPRVVSLEWIERSIAGVVGPAARVYVTDGNAFFNRPGPRLVESLEIMAACVHPEVFSDLARVHAGVIRRLR